MSSRARVREEEPALVLDRRLGRRGSPVDADELGADPKLLLDGHRREVPDLEPRRHRG